MLLSQVAFLQVTCKSLSWWVSSAHLRGAQEALFTISVLGSFFNCSPLDFKTEKPICLSSLSFLQCKYLFRVLHRLPHQGLFNSGRFSQVEVPPVIALRGMSYGFALWKERRWSLPSTAVTQAQSWKKDTAAITVLVTALQGRWELTEQLNQGPEHVPVCCSAALPGKACLGVKGQEKGLG